MLMNLSGKQCISRSAAFFFKSADLTYSHLRKPDIFEFSLEVVKIFFSITLSLQAATYAVS